jgi:hypothetical protein
MQTAVIKCRIMGLANVGVNSFGRNAQAMFSVENQMLDWVSLAKSHGVPAARGDGGASCQRRFPPD